RYFVLLCFYIVLLFFFFSSRRRHTRSTRDWSSDVCSSDLPAEVDNGVRVSGNGGTVVISWNLAPCATSSALMRGLLKGLPVGPRSEERRVGKECRSRRAAEQKKKKRRERKRNSGVIRSTEY